MPGHRMSALPIARYCGMAPKLSVGAGRAAAQSTAFHAMCAKDARAPDLFRRLTVEEQKELLTWRKPADIVLQAEPESVLLRYDDAEHEVTVALGPSGDYVDASDPMAITVGHLDMGWVREVNGHRVAYVGDIKRTPWTTTDGVRSLQLIAYALAFASLHNCRYFVCGIWQATEAVWEWGETIDVYDFATVELWELVRAAALNDSSDYTTGSHCRGCYQRLNCPAHAIRATEGIELSHPVLAPLTGYLTRDNALDTLLKVQAAEEIVKASKSAIQAWVLQNGPIPNGEGKVYRPVPSRGRAHFDEAGFERDHPDLLQQYMVPGAPFDTYRWTNDKPSKGKRK